MGVLENLVSQDQGIEGRGKWLRGGENDSLVIDSERQLFFWNSKGIWGDTLTYLIKVRNMSLADAKTYLSKLAIFGKDYVSNTKVYEGVVPYPELVNVFFKRGLDNRDYWYRRCLTDHTIDRFLLGFNDEWYLIPFFMDGTFENFQCRRDEPEKRIKHWYRGVGPLLFNSGLLKVTNKVVITEGPVDAILLNQYGLPAVSHNSGAEGWRDSWFKYFINQEEIFYVGDNDKAGIAGAIRVAKNLGVYRTKIYTFEGFECKYDTVDFFRDGGTLDEFKNLIYNESKFCWEMEL